jgi:hypothetical protein
VTRRQEIQITIVLIDVARARTALGNNSDMYTQITAAQLEAKQKT